MDQSGQMFAPNILIARTGRPVRFTNSDPELHNINVKNSETKAQSFNVAIPTGESYSYTFEREGFYNVTCDIHPAMAAEIVVSSSPYVAVSDADGTFALSDVPEGIYNIKIYAGKDVISKEVSVKGPTTEVKLDGGEVS